MDWLVDNWIWVALVAAFFALHLFGHGHGHGRGRHARQRAESEPRSSTGDAHGAHGAADAPQNERRRRGGC